MLAFLEPDPNEKGPMMQICELKIPLHCKTKSARKPTRTEPGAVGFINRIGSTHICRAAIECRAFRRTATPLVDRTEVHHSKATLTDFLETFRLSQNIERPRLAGRFLCWEQKSGNPLKADKNWPVILSEPDVLIT